MRERAEAAGGHLVVRSEPGQGSIVRASIPYASESRAASEDGRASDADDRAEIVDSASERVGFFARLFGR
jgi:hypothetical protein